MYCYILNIEAVGSWFQKIFFLKLFPSKSMEAIAKDYKGLANLEPRTGLVGMIYAGDHQILLYTKYISCGPYGYGIVEF